MISSKRTLHSRKEKGHDDERKDAKLSSHLVLEDKRRYGK